MGVGPHLVILEVRHTLIVDIDIVAQYAYAHQSQHIAKPPIAPIMPRCLPPLAAVLPCAVAPTEKADARRVPYVEHPSLELFEILGLPSLVVAHELGRLSKLIAIESSRKRIVAVATDSFRGTCPLIKYVNGVTGMCLATIDFPPQRILVGDGGTACRVDVVLSHTATAYDGLYRIGSCRRLGIGCILEFVVGRDDLLVAFG